MLQTDSPTSTLLATPRSQIQDLPPQQPSPSSPSPPPASTVGRRQKSRKNDVRHPRKSVDMEPATPASDQVTISPLQPTADQIMDWKQQEGVNQPIRVDLRAQKTGKRFTLPKLFTRSSSKQFDPYAPPPPRPDREPSDVPRGCSEDSTVYPLSKSQSKGRRNTAVAEAVAEPRDAEVEVVPVAPSNGTAESRPDGIQVSPPSPSSDAPSTTLSQSQPADDCGHLSSQPSRPQPAHQESSGSQVPESLYPRGASAMKSATSRSRFPFLFKQRALTDPVVTGTSRRDRRRWSKFWKALARKLGWKASPPSSGVPSPAKRKGKAKAPTDSEVGSVVETLPAVDMDESDDNVVGLNLEVRPTASSTPPPRSRSNSPYMERPAAVEPHNVPLPGGESSLSLVSADNTDDGAEQERPETPHHSHSFSSPINDSSTSFTTESPLSVPSFLPDRSATTITLPTTLDPSTTCLDLSIEEEYPNRDEESDKNSGDDTLTEDDTTPTASPCPVVPEVDPSASTYTLQLATSTAIPEDSDSDFDECPPTPHLPAASHPNQTAPQLTTSAPEATAPSPPVATRPDLKRSASTSNVAPKRNGPSKFLFVKHSRWRGNSTLGHELGIRMFEEQYPTIETSLFDARVQRTWLPPPPATHDDDGDSIIDVVDDQYSDFEDEPMGGWREYFEEDDYYNDDDGEEDVSTEHGHGHRYGKQAAEHSEDLSDSAFYAASSSGSMVSSAEEHGHH